MKTRKVVKVCSIFLVAVFTFVSLMTGCGNKAADPKKESSGQAQTVSEKEQLKPYELVYYYPGSVQPDQAAVQNEMNKILKEKINATITLNSIDWGNYDSKMQVTLFAGDPLDLCFTSNWTNNYISNVAKGAFIEVDELLDKYGQDIKKQIPSKMWNAAKVKGKLYAVLNYQYCARQNGVFVKKDLAEKYNLDVSSVKSIKDLEPFLAAVKNGEPNIIPLETYKNANVFVNNLISFGILEVGNRAIPGAIDLNGDKNKIVNQYETATYSDYLKTIHDWFNKGYIKKDASMKPDTEVDRKAGNIAVILTGNMPPYAEMDFVSRYGNAYEVLPIKLGEPMLETNSIIATMSAISKSSKDPERAMMYLNLMFADKQLYRMMCSGIEGTHYTKVSEDVIEVVKDSRYNTGCEWEYGNLFNGFIKKTDPADKLQKQQEAIDLAVPSPILGFNLDGEPIKSEVAQCQAVIDEYENGLESGMLDPDKYLPIFIDKLKKAGSDKIIIEIQKQMDSWKATK